MTWLSLGSLALPFQLQRNGITLKTEITRLSQELGTGQVTRPQQHLRGNIGPLAAIESRLSRLTAYREAATLTSATIDTAQLAMGRLSETNTKLSASLLLASAAGQADSGMVTAGKAAHRALEDSLSTLAQRDAGRAIFSGERVDRAPLPDAQTILTALVGLTAGLDSAAAIHASVTSAFSDPGGLFDTLFYQGGAPVDGGALDDGLSAPALPTAADPAIRTLLAGLASAALIAQPAMALAPGQARDLAQRSAEGLLGNAGAMTAVQAGLGDAQTLLDTHLARTLAERDSLVGTRQTLIGADPYEVATRLQDAQTRLETLYAVTARTSRLTLTEYLR